MAEENKKFDRREIVKTLAGVPFLGGIWWAAWKRDKLVSEKAKRFDNILNIDAALPPRSGSMSGDILRLGIIGPGGRGTDLMRAAGYADKNFREYKNSENKGLRARYEAFATQEDLNVRFTAVCDVADYFMDRAHEAATTDDNKPRKYKHYQDLLADPNVDAVIIATTDHWHAPMAIDALKAGKHVYVEKCLTHKVGETFELERVANANPHLMLQLGHQHRQTQSFLTAQDVINKKVLGHINLVEVCTNRNSDNGAWQYDLLEDRFNERTLDWEQFLGSAPKIPFNLEHFRRWRKWWAYGTGLSGDLLSHDYDRINCVLNLGIPKHVSASGGIYTHRDGRTVPDVMQVVMEFPDYYNGSSQEQGKEKGLTFLYSASLGSSHRRPTILMGHDATMHLGNNLQIYPDRNSTKYKDYIDSKMMNPDTPMFDYDPSKIESEVDGMTGATSKYFADKGLLYTYRDGKRVDSTHLHIRQWLSCIRNGDKPSCGIKEGFEEAISAHMTSLSYKTGKRAEWDAVNRKILLAGEEFSIEAYDSIIGDDNFLKS